MLAITPRSAFSTLRSAAWPKSWWRHARVFAKPLPRTSARCPSPGSPAYHRYGRPRSGSCLPPRPRSDAAGAWHFRRSAAGPCEVRRCPEQCRQPRSQWPGAPESEPARSTGTAGDIPTPVGGPAAPARPPDAAEQVAEAGEHLLRPASALPAHQHHDGVRGVEQFRSMQFALLKSAVIAEARLDPQHAPVHDYVAVNTRHQ